VRSFRFDPAGKEFNIEVLVEELSVREWLSIITNDKIEGEGRLFGRVPVRIRLGEKTPLSFGRGYLHATPGEPGWFQIHDSSLLEEAVRDIPLDPGVIAAEVRSRIIAGLHDFEYSALRFEFQPQDDGGIRCVMFTQGKSRDPRRPVNYQGLTFNFNDFHELLNQRFLGGGFGQ
jgi:hypothetical protein